MTTLSPAFALVDYLLDSVADGTLATFADTDTVYGRYIFLDALPLRINATGKRAVTVTNQPGGTGSGVGSTVYAQNLSIRCYADHTRDALNMATTEDGSQRAWDMFGRLDLLLAPTKPLNNNGAQLILSRAGQPLEFFDQEQDLPYVGVTYDASMLANTT